MQFPLVSLVLCVSMIHVKSLTTTGDCSADFEAMKSNPSMKSEIDKMIETVDKCDFHKAKCAAAQSEGNMVNISVFGWDTTEATYVCSNMGGEICNVDMVFNMTGGLVTTYMNGVQFCLPRSCKQSISKVNTSQLVNFLDRPMFDEIVESCHQRFNECTVMYSFCDRLYSNTFNGGDIPDFLEVVQNNSGYTSSINAYITTMATLLIGAAFSLNN